MLGGAQQPQQHPVRQLLTSVRALTRLQTLGGPATAAAREALGCKTFAGKRPPEGLPRCFRVSSLPPLLIKNFLLFQHYTRSGKYQEDLDEYQEELDDVIRQCGTIPALSATGAW